MEQIVWMGMARKKEQWAHTATIEAMLANVNRDPKRRRKPFTAEDFMPRFGDQHKKKKPPKAPITALRDAFNL